MAKMYRIYSIVERPKQDDYWLNLGVAFPHENGDGFNIVLQALPLPNRAGQVKLVMRAYDAAAAETNGDKPPSEGKAKAEAA
jgi:hypothetical protein